MERERLTRLLDEHGTMAPEDLRALKDMAQRFPWFSGAQLLHAAGERQSGQVLSDETLRVAAAHLPSRSALFDLAQDAAPRKTSPMRVVRIVTPPPAVAEAAPTPEQVVVQSPPVEPEAVAPVTEPSAPSVPIESASEEPVARATEAPVLHEPEVPAVEPERVEELDDQIMKAALASAYDLTWQDRIADPAPVEPSLPAAALAPEPAPAIPAPTGRGTLRFTEWLEAANQTPVVQAQRTAPPVPVPTEPGVKTEKLDAKALIDRFIQHEPPAIPPKPAFFTPQQAAKKSLDDTSGMVTETLARIYEQQGNIQKAIEAYRRLALKYPEKSSYFAALSKALEEKQTP
ncbi:MAG: hypothetical protein H6591_03755 [Flavobacteriales bacterium]|nr:hypothetical protein [Flavobacteriales bacterium]